MQHFAFQACQNEKNYLAPMDKILNASTDEEKRERKVLDVGCGSGIW
jgi:ribosomal protein L11 methylase PrmA